MSLLKGLTRPRRRSSAPESNTLNYYMGVGHMEYSLKPTYLYYFIAKKNQVGLCKK